MAKKYLKSGLNLILWVARGLILQLSLYLDSVVHVDYVIVGKGLSTYYVTPSW